MSTSQGHGDRHDTPWVFTLTTTIVGSVAATWIADLSWKIVLPLFVTGALATSVAVALRRPQSRQALASKARGYRATLHAWWRTLTLADAALLVIAAGCLMAAGYFAANAVHDLG